MMCRHAGGGTEMSKRRDRTYWKVVAITASTVAGLSFGIVQLSVGDPRIRWTPPLIVAALAVMASLLLFK